MDSRKPVIEALVKIEKAISNLIRNFPHQAPKAAWLPISSAPKDGTEILVCRTTRHDGSYMFEDKESLGIWCHRAAWWCDEENRDDGEWIVYNNMVQDPKPFFEPTHWMPLPPPPPPA